MQPFKCFEPNVKVGPSSVLGLGLGLFARRDIHIHQVVCVYSGEKVQCVDGNSSEYLVQADWQNPATGDVETWFLDATSTNTAAGRWANDACDYEGLDESFKTNRKTNIAFRLRIAKYKHLRIGQWYIELYAIEHIVAGQELFVRYGTQYWNRYCKYYKGKDPNIYTGRIADNILSNV